jgi:hypothetical protein
MIDLVGRKVEEQICEKINSDIREGTNGSWRHGERIEQA